MPSTLEVESTLTDRYQTTLPETVRRALRLGKRDKIHYTIRPDGEVVLKRVVASEIHDPVSKQLGIGINNQQFHNAYSDLDYILRKEPQL